MIRALVVDFDGTLLDTETATFRRWQRLYRDHGLELDLASWQEGVGTWDAYDPWEALPEAARAERERLGRELHAGVIDDLHDLDLRPGARALLDEAGAAGLRLALASSSDRSWVARWLERHGLLARFETLCTRDDVRRVKPDPELYRLALERLGLRGPEAVAVEDSLHGATAAEAAGLRVVVVPNDVTATQPFRAEWGRLDDLSGGLAALLAAAGGASG